MSGSTRRLTTVLLLTCALFAAGPRREAAAQAKPEGEMRFAVYVSLVPAWFDPGEVAGVLTPFWVLYALHDALVKPMPGNHNAPSLAESWTVSPDQRMFEFKLREGVKFHNGDPFTAEDVKFSFARAKGKLLHEKVREVEVVSPTRVRFHLHEPWPDFMAFYGTFASGAAWIVPKKYVEQVGKDGFLKHPIGLGPYKFVSHQPGIELVMEAYEGYWRKMPSVKRLVYKSVPESTTRLAMVKRGEADVAYLLDAPQATEVKRDPTLKLAFSGGIGTFYLDFLEQFDPKSPWADKRVRLAAMHAIDVRALSESETLGASKPTGNVVPKSFEFAIPLEPYPYDPAKARKLLAEAGFPNGFDAGDLHPWPPYFSAGESISNYLATVGIRTRVRTMERATFMESWRTKKLSGLIMAASTAPGNAAARLEAFVVTTSAYAAGGYADIDDLFRAQAQERDRKRREAVLHQIQRLMHERVMHAPIFEPATLHGVGPRVEEPAIGLNPLLYFAAPYEDIRLKKP